MRFLILISIFYLILADAAFADPGTALAVGNFILSGLGVATSSLTAIYAVGYAALGAAAYGLGRLAPRPGVPSVNPGRYKQPVELKEGPVIYAWGRVKLGGRYFFKDTAGLNIYRGLLLSQGRMDAFERFFIGNREVIVDSQDGGKVKSFPWSRPDGSHYAFIQTKIGDGTETAYPELKADFADRWTDDHRVRGIGQSLVKLVSPGVNSPLYQKLFNDQKVKNDYSIIFRARLVYDPRLAPIGQANASYSNPVYQVWSDNGILNAIDAFLLQDEFDASHVDWDDIAVEADKADEPVATKAGAEPRSRMSGAFETEAESRANILTDVLDSIDGYVYENFETGLYSIRLDQDNPESEITFNLDEHIISYELSPQEGPVRKNIVRLSYYSSERDYELSEVGLVDDAGNALSWANYPDEIANYGESEFEIGLPFCPSASQGQRKGRRMMAQERTANGLATLNMAGMAAWGRRVVTLDLGALGEIKVRIADLRVDEEMRTVEIAFSVEPTLSPWSPVTDEANAPDQLEALTDAGDLETPEPPTQAATVRYPDGSFELRTIYGGGIVGGVLSEVIYRTFDGNGNPSQYFSMTEQHNQLAYASQASNIVGTKAEFRVRVYDQAADEISNFSEPFIVAVLAENNTIPSAPTTEGGGASQSSSYSITVTIPFEIGIAGLEIDNSTLTSGGITTPKVLPGQVIVHAGNIPQQSQDYFVHFTCVTSDGTRGPTVSILVRDEPDN